MMPASRQRRHDAFDPAAFRRLVDEVRDRHNISDVVGRRTKLKPAGQSKMVGLCCFHEERTPSLNVNDALGVYHCFGCGASGDIISFVMEKEGQRTIFDALRWLGAENLPMVSPEERARRAAEDAAEREAAIGEAYAIWHGAVAAAGTPAEVYARSRGITMPLPPSIRFARTYAWRDRDTGEIGPSLPALIGCVVGAEGFVGIQRIFLRDGGRAKAAMKKPKLSLGRVRGGALRLGPVQDEIIICEGPEDGLTLAQESPGASVWVALGTAMMPEIHYPDEVRRLIVAGQNDAAGNTAVEAAAAKLLDRSFDHVATVYPHPDYKDWNDQLRSLKRDREAGELARDDLDRPAIGRPAE